MTFATELAARIYYLWMLLIYTGIQEKSTWHLEILAQYNKIKPLPRGHEAVTSDSWCAIFVCAIGWSMGFRCWPWECSCTNIREEAKRRGIWREGWSVTPKLGDWLLYNWDGDYGADHIGVVCAIFGNSVWIVEGNYNDAVKIRRITIGDSRVEGTVALNFAELVEAPTEPVEALLPGDSGERVRALQIMLLGAGYYAGAIDGDYGPNTTSAVTEFQAANALDPDGKCGPKTQAKLRSGAFALKTTTIKEVENVAQNTYKRVEDVPEYARPTIRKLAERRLLLGVGPDDLGLTDDLIRMLVINDRAGLYDPKS